MSSCLSPLTVTTKKDNEDFKKTIKQLKAYDIFLMLFDEIQLFSLLKIFKYELL